MHRNLVERVVSDSKVKLWGKPPLSFSISGTEKQSIGLVGGKERNLNNGYESDLIEAAIPSARTCSAATFMDRYTIL